MTTERFCKDCRFFVKGGYGSAFCKLRGSRRNKVTGHREFFDDDCEDMRDADGICKPQANFFEPKLTIWQHLKAWWEAKP